MDHAEKDNHHIIADGHSHHIIPTKKLAMTFGMLVILMILTIVAAQIPAIMPNLDPFLQESTTGRWLMNLVAIGIAVMKAVFVISIFMGVKYGTKLIKLFALGGFVWMLLLSITLVDYFSRPWEPVQGWENMPSSSFQRDKRGTDSLDPEGQIPHRVPSVEEGGHGGGH